MNRTRCLLLALSAVLTAAALAQTPAASTPAPTQTPAPATLPADPAQLLQFIADSNGLHGVQAKPWHLHATWKSQDAQGQTTDQGTLEEWWAAEKRYKLVYTSSKAQQIVYGTDKGRMAVKSDTGVSFALYNIETPLSWPAPPVTPEGLKRMRLQVAPWQTGGVTLTCILQAWPTAPGAVAMTIDKSGQSEPLLNRFCFDPTTGALRVRTGAPRVVTTYNSLVRFQGNYVARAVRSAWAAGQKLDIDVDALETLDPVNDADMIPPADAVPYLRKVAVSSGVMGGNRIGGTEPAYPEEAKWGRVQGTVVLQATIQRDGTIGELRIISGPQELQKAALEAVKTWRYKPYLVNGEPVEVETQINVVFQLGR